MSLLEQWPDLLTFQEAGEILRADPALVRGLVRAGKLSHAEIGGNSLIPRRYLEDFIEGSCRRPGGGGGAEPAEISRTVAIHGVRHLIHAGTEQEYADKLLRLAGMENGAPESPGHPFAEYAMNWFETYSRPNVETGTAITYRRQLTCHILPAFRGLALEDITTDDVQRLFNGMTGTKSSKDKVKLVLNQVLDAAVEDGLILKNPLRSKRIRITGKASRATVPYSVEQMRFLVRHIGDIQLPADRAWLALLALHPLRLEEVLGLQGGDIDPENGEIHIRRAVTHPTRNQPEIKSTKTLSSARTIGLSSLAVPHLPRIPEGEFLFGGRQPMSYTQVRRMCGRVKRDTGFTENITPIRFRTTVLTDLYDQTKDIKLAQAAAGHTTSAMTLRYYVKGREAVSKAVVAVDRAYSV